ncbi:hypothetical protein [Streptomyces noursei]
MALDVFGGSRHVRTAHTGHESHLFAGPHGWPNPEDFALREVPVPEVGEGQILVRTLHFSVHHLYVRARDERHEAAPPPFELD